VGCLLALRPLAAAAPDARRPCPNPCEEWRTRADEERRWKRACEKGGGAHALEGDGGSPQVDVGVHCQSKLNPVPVDGIGVVLNGVHCSEPLRLRERGQAAGIR
jgi:hypothetical protein